MAGKVKEIVDKDFEEEVLKSDIPVLVDFWAPWCIPCVQVGPIVEEIAGEYEGRIKVVKVNVDDNREFATKFNVQGIPNFVMFKNGEVTEQKAGTGASAKKELAGLIETALA